MAFPLTDEEHQHIEAGIQALPEIIVAAAIRYKGCILMAERPGRHGNCLNWMSHNTEVGQSINHECGFVTSRGRFVDRQEAGQIVRYMGQGSPGGTPENNPRDLLYSEDMWNESPTERADSEPLSADSIF